MFLLDLWLPKFSQLNSGLNHRDRGALEKPWAENGGDYNGRTALVLQDPALPSLWAVVKN